MSHCCSTVHQLLCNATKADRAHIKALEQNLMYVQKELAEVKQQRSVLQARNRQLEVGACSSIC